MSPLSKIRAQLGEELVLMKPHIHCAEQLSDLDQKILRELGLPKQVGDWFRACPDITESEDGQSCKIGQGEFGAFAIRYREGAIIYQDDSGGAQLINSSLECFLMLVGLSAHIGKTNIESRSGVADAFREIDPTAMEEPEGIWPLLAEELGRGIL